ncbi:MAG: hypothetical protein ABL866_08440 [Devosia sp.]
MRGISFWFVFLGTLFALAGMAWGVQMSMTQDHQLAPAHAHNNLIGYVTMVIYGFYYALVPVASKSRLALVHFWVALVGSLTFGAGIAMAIQQKGEVLVQVSTLFVLAGMLIFAWTVWANRSALMSN